MISGGPTPFFLARKIKNQEGEIEGLQTEIKEYRQALWDCAKYAGADLDGDPTPEAVTYGLIPFAVDAVRELREERDEGFNTEVMLRKALEEIRLAEVKTDPFGPIRHIAAVALKPKSHNPRDPEVNPIGAMKARRK